MNWILLQILVVCLKILRFVMDKLSDIIYYAIYESRASIKLPPIKNRILLMPASTIANKIRSRDLTSYEVCEAFIDRINSVNDVTNAVVDNRFDDALGQFGCGILKIVDPKMQDFCPRINMLKGIF